MIVWIIGLSGSGKTTLGESLYKDLKKKYSNTIFVDGDTVRKIWGTKLSHSIKDRKINARRISYLCKFLDDNKINAVVSILSIFPKWQKWNRKNFKNYYQIYISSEIEKIKKRYKNNLYSRLKKKNLLKNVVGLDIKFPTPYKSNLIIKNNSSKEKFLLNKKIIMKKILKNFY